MRPATTTVIILSLIGGLRSFDLIWAMTRGGPGFTSDVIASVIYKQYQAGLLRPLDRGQRHPLPRRDGDHPAALLVAQPKEVDRDRTSAAAHRRHHRDHRLRRRLPRPVRFIVLTALSPGRRRPRSTSAWPQQFAFFENLVAVFEARDFMLVTAFVNSTIITVASVTFMVIFAAMVGWVLQRRQSRGGPA